jgi:hypothetical protein
MLYIQEICTVQVCMSAGDIDIMLWGGIFNPITPRIYCL